MKLFDFDGTRKEFEIKEDEIKYMLVAIVSGAEIVEIYYKDGSVELIDVSKESRLVSLFDTFYLVEKKNLNKFIKAEVDSIDAETRKKEFERLCAKTS